MSRIYTRNPRQVDACIPLHPGELASIVCQDAMLKGFTEEELGKIHTATRTELQSRDKEWIALNESQDKRYNDAATKEEPCR